MERIVRVRLDFQKGITFFEDTAITMGDTEQFLCIEFPENCDFEGKTLQVNFIRNDNIVVFESLLDIKKENKLKIPTNALTEAGKLRVEFVVKSENKTLTINEILVFYVKETAAGMDLKFEIGQSLEENIYSLVADLEKILVTTSDSKKKLIEVTNNATTKEKELTAKIEYSEMLKQQLDNTNVNALSNINVLSENINTAKVVAEEVNTAKIVAENTRINLASENEKVAPNLQNMIQKNEEATGKINTLTAVNASAESIFAKLEAENSRAEEINISLVENIEKVPALTEEMIVEGTNQTNIITACGDEKFEILEQKRVDALYEMNNLLGQLKNIIGKNPGIANDALTIAGKTFSDLLSYNENIAGMKFDENLMYLNDVGEKFVGTYYFDKNKKGLFRCIKGTISTVNSTTYFVEESIRKNSDKLENLFKVKYKILVTYPNEASIVKLCRFGTTVYCAIDCYVEYLRAVLLPDGWTPKTVCSYATDGGIVYINTNGYLDTNIPDSKKKIVCTLIYSTGDEFSK